MAGTLVITTVPLQSTDAAITGSTAFLEPCILISPFNLRKPWISTTGKLLPPEASLYYYPMIPAPKMYPDTGSLM